MPGVTDAALQALFAPYCGGVSRGGELTEALQILQRGELWGRRPVQGTDGHRFQLTWSGVAAPQESIRCEIRFPSRPEGNTNFSLLTHQLVAWLMDRSARSEPEPDLPNGFWEWLWIERGDATSSA